jgi:hypothetical protein
MMFPPVFALANASAPVKAIFGISPLRIYAFGEATQATPKPYAVWQSIGISPENYLNQTPDADFMPTQIDVYADTAAVSRSGAQALRDLYQQYGYVTTQREWPREPDTNLYRYQIDIDFWQYR